jgi:hypothetical protein
MSRPEAPFALRLWSYRLAAGMIRSQLEAAAGLPAGVVKYFEERGVNPHARTRWRLAKMLGAPDLEGFDTSEGRPTNWVQVAALAVLNG